MTIPFLSRRALFLLGATAVVLAACGGGGGGYSSDAPPATTPTETISAVLTGDQEAPLQVNTGAIGNATFVLDRSTRTLSGTVKVDGVVPTAAHIHLGQAGTAGTISIALTVAPNHDISLPATALTASQLASLDAGELYVNVHSDANPGGEIRGQIGREVFVARLSGDQETSPVSTTASGSGYVVLNPLTRSISGEVRLSGITATAAHIHTGAFGSDGGILVSLTDHGGHGHYEVPDSTVLSQANVDLLRAGGLYFNAHSAANPTGEVRGQIGRRVLAATATGMQEVPSNASVASGRAFVVYDPATRGITAKFSVFDMTATVAHVHIGAAGVNGAIAVPLAETSAGSGVWSTSTSTTLSADRAQALLTGGMYVNAHSASFSAGEIRGQLGREVYNASMTGAQETVAVATTATGTGLVILDPETLSISAEMQLAGISATVAHIHTGALGTNGAVEFPFVVAPGSADRFVLAGAALTATQAQNLRSGNLYFNAHSAANPTGEIRGQIGVRVLAAAASGAQEVPANASVASGRALISMNPVSREIKGRYVVSGMTATVAHIHSGAVGINGSIALGFTETAALSGIFEPATGAVFTAAQAKALLAGDMYVNAHSTAFPAGEVRGQLALQ